MTAHYTQKPSTSKNMSLVIQAAQLRTDSLQAGN